MEIAPDTLWARGYINPRAETDVVCSLLRIKTFHQNGPLNSDSSSQTILSIVQHYHFSQLPEAGFSCGDTVIPQTR
jgi:hypothetical protein